jgi:hypothetical protein
MKRLLCSITVVLIVSCAVYKAQLPGSINHENSVYVNKDAGFMLTLPPAWDIGTNPKTAPSAFRGTFKALQSNSVEALFLGSDKHRHAYVRCMAEAYNGSLESYFNMLVEAVKSQLTPVQSDYFKGAGSELVIWSYWVKSSSMDFLMNEYVFDLGALKCRLSFWTLPGLTDDYKETFEDVARSICIFDTTGDTAAGCARVWRARDSAQISRPHNYGIEKR